MKKGDLNLEKHKIKDGMTVPEGYFADFEQRMEKLLPYNEAAENPDYRTNTERRSWWEKARPFIYMAAMFAGIWCMTKMFSLMKENNSDYFSSPSMVAALSNSDFIDDYVYYSVDEYDIIENLYDEGITLTSLN